MATAREIKKGDPVSYHGRLYKVLVVWGGAHKGNINIMPVTCNPHDCSVNTRADLLVWSDTRIARGASKPGCWIVMKPKAQP